MSSKNTWDGLQFRVMETLEQAKGVPLTALEIAQRLHESEYRHEMRDNVNFKVTRACHAMREKGRIIVTDARDREGRLTYALPQRVIFPRKDHDMPPANPVLTPDVAEKIKPVERVEEPAPKKGKRSGSWLNSLTPEQRSEAARKASEARWGEKSKAPTNINKIVAILDAAPHPLTAPEIEPLVKDIWPNPTDIKPRLATMLHAMEKSRRIFQMPSTKRVKGVKYEYYTKKTGKYAPPPVQAPLPSQTWKEPKKPVPAPVAQPKPGLFRPGQHQVVKKQLNVDVPEDKLHKYKDAAEKFGVTFNQFVIDAIDFALDHTE